MGRKAIELTGRKFGKLTVKCRVSNIPRHHAKWLCKCECGNETIAESHSLLSGKKLSCGCLLVTLHKTHGMAKTRLYNVWNIMKQRCCNPNNKNYKQYGERGIKVCEEWQNSFECFYKWALNNGYDEQAQRGKTTIDRINNNGNYEPTNCRWVTQKENCQNRRTNKCRIN